MSEEKLYTINEIINDAKIARSTFDKFAEANNLRPRKTEKRGKKFYSLSDKEFVVTHYQRGKGKEAPRAAGLPPRFRWTGWTTGSCCRRSQRG